MFGKRSVNKTPKHSAGKTSESAAEKTPSDGESEWSAGRAEWWDREERRIAANHERTAREQQEREDRALAKQRSDERLAQYVREANRKDAAAREAAAAEERARTRAAARAHGTRTRCAARGQRAPRRKGIQTPATEGPRAARGRAMGGRGRPSTVVRRGRELRTGQVRRVVEASRRAGPARVGSKPGLHTGTSRETGR